MSPDTHKKKKSTIIEIKFKYEDQFRNQPKKVIKNLE